MSETNTLITIAGLAGALYLGHRWLTHSDTKTNPTTAGAEPDTPAAPPGNDPPARTPPAPRAAAGYLPRTFDPIFAAHARGIPIAYLRSLAARESDLRPDLATGPAWGLMQVMPTVLDTFNKHHGTAFRRADLLNPEINVRIATHTLRTIINGYRQFHPEVPNLLEDWRNLRFVELLTFGWNAGFSERGGVGLVASYLSRLGFTDITIDLVHAHAAAAGASRHLSNEKKVRWCKGVARLYQREAAHDAAAKVA